MKKFILTTAVNWIALWIIQYLFIEVQIQSMENMVILAATLTLLSWTVKPILKFLSFPITFLTLGLFLLVINTIVLELAFYLIEGALIKDHWIAFLSAMVISVVHALLNRK